MLAVMARDLEASLRGVSWGVCVRAEGADPETAGLASESLRTASMGKVLLLLALARLIEGGEIDPAERLGRSSVAPVADSGLWQHLAQPGLEVNDLAVLVGSVSDNLATNVLVERIGFEFVETTRSELGLESTRLLDVVRDVRGPDDPIALSTGSAEELSGLFGRLRDDARRGEPAAHRVVGWLRPGCDLSMVASAFNLDPLAHVDEDRDITIVNKTGTNTTVRADAGFVEGPGGAVTYAFLANWTEAADRRDAVMAAMRRVGKEIRLLAGV